MHGLCIPAAPAMIVSMQTCQELLAQPGRRRVLAALAALTPSLLLAQQQTTGEGQPLRMIVPFTPGTGIDLIARTVGPKLGQRLNRPVGVENRAGASGNIRTEFVVRSPADGNTLLVSVNTLVMNKSLYPQLPFDP